MRSRYLLVARHPAEVDTLPLSTKVDFPKKNPIGITHFPKFHERTVYVDALSAYSY